MPCEIDPPKGPPPPPPSAKEPKSPSKEHLKSEIVQLKREVKTLRQKVKRKVGSLSNLIDDLKEKALIGESTVTVLKNKFSGTTLELIKNQLLNQEKDPKGRRYEEELKKVRLHFKFLFATCL